MTDGRKTGDPMLRDEGLVDSAALSADMLRSVARRWQLRLQAGRLGAHSADETRALIARLEAAAGLIEEGGTAVAESVAANAPAPAATSSSFANSEERFRFLVDNVNDYSLFMLEPDGRIASWNAGAQRIKGYRAEEVLGKHFSVFYPPEDAAAKRPERALDIAAREGRYIEEGWRCRKSGERFWAHVTITALRDEQGRLRGFAKLTRDVTEVKEALEALRQSEGRMRLMVESVRDYAIITLDQTGHITWWNAGAERLNGYKADEVLGKHFSLFYTDDAKQAHHAEEELRAALEDGRYEEEGWRVRKDGTRFWANVVITAVFDKNDEHIGFTKVTRDFSERKRADEQLRDSEERLRLLVESVKDYAIFMLDPQGHIATWNRGAEHIKGYRADEIIGRHFSAFYTPEDLARAWPQHELDVARREGRYEEEGWRVRKNGERFWANVVITAVRDPTSGALRGFSKVTRDLTERRRMEQEARMALEDAARERARAVEAQAALQSRDEFISVAAHELRTPLTALQLKIEGVVKALRREGHGPGSEGAKHAERLDGALRHIDRFTGLVERLLDVSRIARGKLGLKITDVDLAALARQAGEDFHGPAQQQGSELRVEAPPSLVGRWDKARIEQVLINVVSNAIKYGNGQPIDVRVEAIERGARLTVTDRGIGIGPADVERIFARFERAAPVASYAGLGLGLYITRNIVEAHGGSIRVTSELEKGSTFTIDLPLRVDAREVSSGVDGPARSVEPAERRGSVADPAE